MGILRNILLQISIICSMVCIFTKILDWYNPYMDFSGHIGIIQICLCVSVIALYLQSGRRR